MPTTVSNPVEAVTVHLAAASEALTAAVAVMADRDHVMALLTDQSFGYMLSQEVSRFRGFADAMSDRAADIARVSAEVDRLADPATYGVVQ